MLLLQTMETAWETLGKEFYKIEVEPSNFNNNSNNKINKCQAIEAETKWSTKIQVSAVEALEEGLKDLQAW